MLLLQTQKISNFLHRSLAFLLFSRTLQKHVTNRALCPVPLPNYQKITKLLPIWQSSGNKNNKEYDFRLVGEPKSY